MDNDEVLKPIQEQQHQLVDIGAQDTSGDQIPGDINWADWDTFMADLDMSAQFEGDFDQFNTEVFGQNSTGKWYG